MIRYKINVADALQRAGFNSYKAKVSGLLSQETLKKIKNEDTNISLKTLNNLCLILDMDPKDLITFETTEDDKNKLEQLKNKG